MNREVVVAAIAAAMLGSGICGASPKPSATKKSPPKTSAKTTAKPPAPPRAAPPVALPSGTDKRRVIGILDIRVDGAPPEVGAQFQRDLESQVDIDHYFLAPRTRMREIMANSTRWTEGCLIGPCLADVKTNTNADVVLLAALSGEGTSFGWVVTLVRTDSGSVLGQRAERCDVCTVNEALSTAALATVDLLSTIPDTLPDEHPHSPDPALSAVAPLHAKIERLEHRHRATGIGLAIAGLAIAAAGSALYLIETPHPTYGAATAAGGMGLAVGGLVLMF